MTDVYKDICYKISICSAYLPLYQLLSKLTFEKSHDVRMEILRLNIGENFEYLKFFNILVQYGFKTYSEELIEVLLKHFIVPMETVNEVLLSIKGLNEHDYSCVLERIKSSDENAFEIAMVECIKKESFVVPICEVECINIIKERHFTKIFEIVKSK